MSRSRILFATVALLSSTVAAAQAPATTTRQHVESATKGASVIDDAGKAARLGQSVREATAGGSERMPYVSAHYGHLDDQVDAIARQGEHVRRGAKIAGAVGTLGTAAQVGTFTYDMARCTGGNSDACWSAGANAVDYGSQTLADRTPMGAVISRSIRYADDAYQLVDPKGRTAMGAFVDGVVAPAVAPHLGYEFVPEWDSYATKKQAAQFRHYEALDQIRRAREMREAFAPTYTPRDGGSEYDPLAAVLGTLAATAACADPTAPSCAAAGIGAAAPGQVNECDHPGHDPSHICDANGKTISRGGSSQ